jgi:heat shock protein HspQ
MQERFAIGDRVEHQKFGQGVVIDVRASKIDVKFGRELKTLIHAG